MNIEHNGHSQLKPKTFIEWNWELRRQKTRQKLNYRINYHTLGSRLDLQQ